MKSLRILYCISIAAVSLITSCSDDLSTDNSTTENSTNGKLYLAVNLQLPTVDASRAVPDVYEDGDPEEYAINKATLYVYKYPKADATSLFGTEYVDKIDLDFDAKFNSNVGITTTNTAIAQFDFLPDFNNYNYFTFIVINANGKNPLPDAYPTFEAYHNAVWKNGGYQMFVDKDDDGNYNNFYMTNIMMYNAAKSKYSNVYTYTYQGKQITIPTNASFSCMPVVFLPSSQLRSTPADALTSDGMTIAVERGVAKVTMLDTNHFWQSDGNESNIDWSNAHAISSTADNYVGGKVVFLNWMVSNTNGYSYPMGGTGEVDANGSFDIQHYNAIFMDNVKEMIDRSEFSGNSYRMNWTFSPRYYTYSGSFSYFPPTHISAPNGYPPCEVEIGERPDAIDLKVTDKCYVLENTMNYDSMIKRFATRVILKAKYRPGATGSYDEDGTFFYLGSRFISSADLLARINSNLPSGVSTLSLSDVNFSNIPLKNSMLTTDVLPSLTDEQIAELNANLGITDDDHGVARYDKGYCYYEAFIRHFSDEVDGIAYTGGDYTIQHLGRYGVVRNNWYKLNVQDVFYPGSPDVPSLPTDDEIIDGTNTNIKMEISANAWARRSQSVIL